MATRVDHSGLPMALAEAERRGSIMWWQNVTEQRLSHSHSTVETDVESGWYQRITDHGPEGDRVWYRRWSSM